MQKSRQQENQTKQIEKVSVALIDDNSSVESADQAIPVKFNELLQQNQQHKLEIVSGVVVAQHQQRSGYELSQKQQNIKIQNKGDHDD